MHLPRPFGILLAMLAGLSACAPLPGVEFIEQGRQSSIQGDWDGSITAINQALQVAVDDKVFYYSYFKRCEAHIWKGQTKTALDDCNKSIRTMPDKFGYAYAARGRIFALMGQYQWALEDFEVAIKLKSARSGPVKDSATVIAYGGKARVLATSPEDDLRNAEKSIEFAQAAVGFEKYLKTPAHKILNRDTLAAAYAEAGRFGEAVAEHQKTIAMVKDNGWNSVTYDGKPLMNILSDHLSLFEAQKPLRGGIY
ncbi:MAG: tetratricopeptide repeat protein [Rhodospirillales bacterium]|nr:tetratricopeptide repeat protein [Rhodospirillales bacterium]